MKTILILATVTSITFANISVITPKNNKLTNITEKELTNLFLKKTNHIRGIKITPIDSSNRELYEQFYKKVIKKTPSQIREYWINQVYKGTKQPPKRLSSNQIKKEIEKNSMIITYATNHLNGKLILTIK